MIIRLLHIDFAARDAALSVYKEDGDEDGRHLLDHVLTILADTRIATVTFHCGRAAMNEVQSGVVSSPDSLRLDAMVTAADYVLRPNQFTNALWSNQRSGELLVARTSQPVYAMRLTNLDRAVANATIAASAISATNGHGKNPPVHLRLACHELVTNSVEHAVFSVGVPEIRIGMRFNKRGAQLSFRDNAEEFNTETLVNVDIRDKISRGEGRGLGLFMLNKIAETFVYERADEWNLTTLFIPYAQPERQTRRNPMSEINIMITPCNIEGTVVLRPVGTLDSATSNILETQIAQLVNQNVKRIVMDMADIEFISSSGIGVFLGSVSDLRSRGGDLVFMNVPAHIDDVFDIVNLKAYFRTISSIEELQTTR